MTTAKWINPPSLEGRKGVVGIQTKAGSTVSWTLSKADGRQPEQRWDYSSQPQKPGASFVQTQQKLRTTSTQWAEEEKNKEKNVFYVREHGKSTGLIFYQGGWRRKTKDKPEDTTDHVTMETRTWKRTQGPLEVDELPWLASLTRFRPASHRGERYTDLHVPAW